MTHVSEASTTTFVPRTSPLHDWRSWAACRSMDPDLFFPSGRLGAALEHIEAAKAVCRSCPVKGACLDYALASNQQDGVWGGTSEEERRSLRSAWLVQRRGRTGEHGGWRGSAGPDRTGDPY